MIDAIRFRDVPLIEITVLIASAVYVLANLLADLATLLLNPKLRQAQSMTDLAVHGEHARWRDILALLVSEL